MTHVFAIEALLKDPDVLEIMINGHKQVLVERTGKLEEVPSPYRDEAHLRADIEAIVTPLGHRLTESTPILDVRLADGSLVNIVGHPIALNGPSVVIRRFVSSTRQVTLEDTLRFGSWTEDMVKFVRACVLSRQNILVAGGTGSGKTTIANHIAAMIPHDERIIVCQPAPTMIITQPWVVILEARPANLEGRGEITVGQLIENAVKMRPDRIIVPEVSGKEAAALIEPLTAGIDGSIFTMHANSVRNALERFETYILSGSPTMPILSARETIANGVQFVLYQERLSDGKRKMMRITEVLGIEGGLLHTQDIFEYRQTGMKDGKITGYFTATGLIPRRLGRMRDLGLEVPMEMFVPHRA